MDDYLNNINAYYTSKHKLFGNTPAGVDWRDEASQLIRFKQLSKIITKKNFSVLDYGCGYGALYNYLKTERENYSYFGYDIAEEMIAAATVDKSMEPKCLFTINELQLLPCNYVIASGIFNVRLTVSDTEWEKYIINTLEKINSLSIDGFSFNMLPSSVDPALKKDYLYYADHCWIENECKKITEGNISVITNYNLFEFTVLITK